MREIWRSQTYQLKREGSVYAIWSALLIACMTMILFGTKPWKPESGIAYTGSYEWTLAGAFQAPFAVLFAIIISILIMGMDYGNQTVNYDLLAGCQRKHVFLGRSLLAILVAVGGAALIMILAPFSLAVTGGFGDALPVWNYAVRTLVFLLLVLRVACEGILIMTVTKKRAVAYLTVIILLLFFEWSTDGPPKNELILADTAASALFEVAGWSSLQLNGELLTEYDASLPVATLLSSAGFSLLIAFLSLAMAAFIFSEDDF